MIQDVLGIKDFQTNLPKIARSINQLGGHYLVTNRNRPTMVAIPFEDYKAIEDILLELSSPRLQREIKQGRLEYMQGKTKTLEQILADIEQ